MKVYASEYLKIDLDREVWECRRCDYVIGSARENYKKGLKLFRRNPQEIHRPIIDPERYEYTFAPDPAMCAIIESYCPGCGVMVDTEYVPPGMAPTHDLEFDIDALKAYWEPIGEIDEPGVGPDNIGTGGACGHSH